MRLENRQFSKTGTSKRFFLMALIFCSSLAYSQSAINILDLYFESFPEKAARTLTANALIGNYTFHSTIGGVSFQAVASPAENLKDQNVSLDFEGNRFAVHVGAKTVYPDLPFWQLVPIVYFANSPYTVAVSELGDTINDKEAQCRFHPAFLDNLLGLRLFQADLLNLTDILWDLPIDAQRNYIVAPSEQPFTPVRDSTLLRKIYEKLAAGDYTSFVLTDKDVPVVFDLDNSGLKFSGNPYYYFTKTEVDTATVSRLQAQALDCYDDIDTHAKLLLKEKFTPELNPRTHLDELKKALSAMKQGNVFNPYSMYAIQKAINKIDSMNRLTDEQIGIRFRVASDYTESFIPYWDLLKKFNPPVYSAVENTSHWAAFFRYVRQANPEKWSQFVKEVESINAWDAPAVQTPTSSDINYFRYFEEREKSNK